MASLNRIEAARGVNAVRAAFLFGAAALAAPALAQGAPAKAPDLAVKLFEAREANRQQGCTFVLWQANRDPEKDRYAYAFVEPLGTNENRRPARIKIGERVVELTRIAVGGAKVGYGVHPFALYREKAGMDGVKAFLEIKAADEPGEVVEVAEGTLTIVQAGFAPFAMRVKGNAGCNTPAAAPAPAPAARRPARPGGERGVENIFVADKVPGSRIPAALKAEARKRFECRNEVMNSGAQQFQMSEESALWEIPCDSFAYQGTSIFVRVYLPDPGTNFEFLSFRMPKGVKREGEPYTQFGTQWDVRRRTLSAYYKGRGLGDCGTFERWRVNEAGEFVLVEYRAKTECDGKGNGPDSFPKLYPR